MSDRITEPQEWIDGLVREYSESEDIDCALQNMGLELKRLRAELERVKAVFLEYMDELEPGAPTYAELRAELEECKKQLVHNGNLIRMMGYVEAHEREGKEQQ